MLTLLARDGRAENVLLRVCLRGNVTLPTCLTMRVCMCVRVLHAFSRVGVLGGRDRRGG